MKKKYNIAVDFATFNQVLKEVKRHAKVTQILEQIGVISIEADDAQLKFIKKVKGVLSVEEDRQNKIQ